MADYAKVVILGSPISKSNFKLWNKDGRAILPNNSGKYHDRYALYEDEIALQASLQNPGVVFNESLIAILKVYYKSEKRHPDTNNITKSIFDGIEKSGLIVNDAQVRRLIIEEYYDKINPRFELELFKESVFKMTYTVSKTIEAQEPIVYGLPVNKKVVASNSYEKDILDISRKIKRDENTQANTKKIKPSVDNEKVPTDSNKTKAQLLLESLEKELNTNSSKGKYKVNKKEDIEDSFESKLICNVCGKKITNNNYKTHDNGKKIICSNCLKKLW